MTAKPTLDEMLHEFREKFLPDLKPEDMQFLPEQLMAFRQKRLEEEVFEARDAVEAIDVEGYIDALVDTVYIAIGTAHLMGFDFYAHFKEVHDANMRKVRASADGGNSKHKSSADIVKPEGWTGPDHKRVMDGTRAQGWADAKRRLSGQI